MLEQGLNYAFPTPILLVRWPRHNEIHEAVTKLESCFGLDTLPANPFKLESRNRIHELGVPSLSALFDFTVGMAAQMISETTGRCLDENVRFAQAEREHAYRYPDGSAKFQPYPNSTAFIAVMDAWINGYDQGQFHPPHSHPRALFAAVYCIAVPDGASAPQGALALMDPRREAVNHRAEIQVDHEGVDILHTMYPGDLLIFPGWLTHYVFPHGGAGRRLSLSMNLGVQNIEVPNERSNTSA